MGQPKSPSKILRNAIRMAKFNESKKMPNPTTTNVLKLSTFKLPQVGIPPIKYLLNIVKTTSMSISPSTRNTLSCVQTSSTDLPPDPFSCFYCDLVCPKPNLPLTPTSPYQVCSICSKPLSYFSRDPMECCGSGFHENCWGEHDCKRLL